MTFVPDSQVRLCSVPFSDQTNILSFGTDDTARANYFQGKTVTNLTSDTGYNYVRGSRAIRVNKNKETLYNVNYMMYRNSNFGSKWFYAFVDSMEFINANCTEIKFSIDVWQTWESSLTFKESFIVRQHIKKSEDTIGANLQPEGFTNLRYVEEKRFRKNLIREQQQIYYYMLCASSWYDENSKKFVETNNSGLIDNNLSGIFIIPFESEIYLRNYVNNYLQDTANRAQEIIAIYCVPWDSFTGKTFTNGIPLGISPNVQGSENEWWSADNRYRLNKLTSIDIGTHGTSNIKTAKNNKMYTFPFTKVILTNNNGSSLTYRQEWFDGTKTDGNDIVFKVTTSPLLPVNSVCRPENYREGDETNAIILSGFPQCSWVTDTYKMWLAQNQNMLAYQQATPIINGITNQVNNLIAGTTGGASNVISGMNSLTQNTEPKAQANTLLGLIAGRISSLGSQATGTISNAVSTGEQIWQFYAKKGDMELQPNYSQGVYNSANVMGAIEKLCFTVVFQRLSYEQFIQIDNYFSKFGYAINDFKNVSYNNRSNYDYIQTAQVTIEGDVPEEDMNNIKTIFNNGVRIWHNPTNFLNYNVDNN